MTKERLTHLIAFLGSLATAVLPSWLDPQQTWPARIGLVVVTALLLAVDPRALRTQKAAILGGLAVLAAMFSVALGKFTQGTAGGAALGFTLAALTQMRALIASRIPDVGAASESQPKIAIITQPDTTPTNKPAA